MTPRRAAAARPRGAVLLRRGSMAAALVAALTSAAPAGAAFTSAAPNAANGARAAAVFAPRAAAPPTVAGTARQFERLAATDGAWERQPATLERRWLRCDERGEACAAIAGATSATYTPAAADVGRRLRAEVTARNAGGATRAVSAPTAVVAAGEPYEVPAATAPPHIDGTARIDATLTATTGQWRDARLTFAYQWLRCTPGCAALPGETRPRYRLESADTGATLRVRVTASSPGGTGVATSAPTAPVARRSLTYVACVDPLTGRGVGPTGGRLPPGFSSVHAGDGLDISRTVRCDPGAAHPTLEAKITGGGTSAAKSGHRWRYDVAPHLTLVGGHVMRRSAFGRPLSTSLVAAPDGDPFESFSGCWHNLGCTEEADGRRAIPASARTGFAYTLHCHTNGDWCSATGTHAIEAARLELHDEAPPVVRRAPSGSLATDATIGASAALAVEARDEGAGLYRVRVLLDDTEVAATVPDPLGGRCADVDPATPDRYEFASHTPCPHALATTVAFDTAAWPRGARLLHVLLEDAGGNTVTLVKRRVTVAGG